MTKRWTAQAATVRLARTWAAGLLVAVAPGAWSAPASAPAPVNAAASPALQRVLAHGVPPRLHLAGLLRHHLPASA